MGEVGGRDASSNPYRRVDQLEDRYLGMVEALAIKNSVMRAWLHSQHCLVDIAVYWRSATIGTG